jgi:hypothetical protein
MEILIDKSIKDPEGTESCPACKGKGMYQKPCFTVDEFGGPFMVVEEVVWEDCTLCQGKGAVKHWVARNYKETKK